MRVLRVLTRGPEETAEAGSRLGKSLRAGQTVCLFGGLGAGKTTFVKGIARALGIDPRDVTSPSFTIVAEYGSRTPLYHIDLYRLATEADIESAGVYEYIGADGIAVVEWAEKMHTHPGDAINVRIGFVSGGEREIIIEGADEGRDNNEEGKA